MILSAMITIFCTVVPSVIQGMVLNTAVPLWYKSGALHATGRVAKWVIELSDFDITYKARTAIKAQVLADFISEWTEAPIDTPVPKPEPWLMHFNGSKQLQGSDAGVTLKSPTGEELQYVL